MSDERVKITPYEPVELPAELIAELESMEDRNSARRTLWTDKQDAILLNYWEKKRQADIAKIIGRHSNTCRARFEYLKRQMADGKPVKEYVE